MATYIFETNLLNYTLQKWPTAKNTITKLFKCAIVQWRYFVFVCWHTKCLKRRTTANGPVEALKVNNVQFAHIEAMNAVIVIEISGDQTLHTHTHTQKRNWMFLSAVNENGSKPCITCSLMSHSMKLNGNLYLWLNQTFASNIQNAHIISGVNQAWACFTLPKKCSLTFACMCVCVYVCGLASFIFGANCILTRACTYILSM